MKYKNFDLEVSDDQQDDQQDDQGERFRVRVVESPAGQQRMDNAEEVVLPSEVRPWVRQLANRLLTLEEMISLGKMLADCLFPPRARDLLMSSRARLDNGEGLRIRLRLSTYTLADLPWEYVYVPRPDTLPGQERLLGFLVLNRRVSLVRYELMEQRKESLEPVGTSPLRLVVLMADPGGSSYDALDLEAERRNIQEALEDVPAVRPEFYPDATVDTILDAVTKDAHIFHFAGHGEFGDRVSVMMGSADEGGSIVLLGEGGGPHLFPADRLAQTLLGRGIRLAVLGACKGGARDRVNAWTGVAPALTRAGIPAVVGMQFAVKDRNAIAFSRQFYRALAAGKPIDAAVTDGRLAILNRSTGRDERDWGVPVLYLRAEEGVLFPAAESGPPVPDGAQPPKIEPATDDVDQRALRMAMVGFSLEELEIICADVEQAMEDAGIRVMGRPIPVSLEVVGGRSKPGQVLNLIQYLDRRGYLGYLVSVVRQHRPGII